VYRARVAAAPPGDHQPLYGRGLPTYCAARVADGTSKSAAETPGRTEAATSDAMVVRLAAGPRSVNREGVDTIDPSTTLRSQLDVSPTAPSPKCDGMGFATTIMTIVSEF